MTAWVDLPVADWRLALALAAALVAGTVRGLTGFGAALIFLPLAGLAYGPKTAMPVLWNIDLVAALPMALSSLLICRWKMVLALVAGAALVMPFGYQLLAVMDGYLVQWILCTVILLSVAGLASGFRLSRPPQLPGIFGVGLAAGTCGSLAGLSGPPVILFWLASAVDKAVVRADIFAFFVFISAFAGIGYTSIGLFGPQTFGLAAVALPIYAFGMWAGAKLFHRTSNRDFQRLALAICAAAALAGLPLWT